ncbi:MULTISPECIES: PAS domain S-box protein [Cyanophyceae]|uniref:PAS domain S-box protein n=1 Tax=Leptolyngbya subtilissima DQ-A4 TaxID=2933933 RepID=A0ABV0K8J1_9CYAN|nr:PAS domain S-box protein [Nodosilinea sp. FACHB-141]MBD2110255.1 PAS domain S-box protein [Nodosilinea sp. FACHB-141]
MNNLTDDAERLAAVHRYHILDMQSDKALDRVTAIAARLFQVPIALVTIVDRDRIWFKSRYGVTLEQIDRELGLCASAILQGEVYAITDARQDPRTQSNSLVQGELGLRFYAAAPLTTADGMAIGTLCIIDHQPRQLTANETQTLADLAAVVMEQLELQLSSRQLIATTAAQRVAIDNLYHQAPCGYHSLDSNGVFIEINDTELGWLGYEREAVVGRLRFWDVITPASQATFAANFSLFKQRGRISDLEFELVGADGSTQWILLNAIAEYDEQGNYVSSRSTAYNISDRKRTEIALRQLNQSLEAKVAERTAELAERNAELETSNQALHLSNQRFRNAFDYAGIGMALVSLEGHWLEVNRSLCEITGYSEDELLATTFQAITHPDDLDTDLDLVRQLLNQDIRHYHLEKRYRHRQGHWIWVMLSVSIVTDEQQVPLYFVSQIQDVNERKQSEIALRKSQAMLLESQSVGRIGSWEYDVATQKVTWSAEKFRILGRDPALGEPGFDELLRLYHPEDGDYLRQSVEQALTTGEPYSIRIRCNRSDGTVGYIDDRGQAERNAQDEVVRLYGIAQDISDRVQAERELREMSTALAHAVEGISRLDNAGRYISVNQAYAAMVGYTPEELVGQTWQITVHPDDLDRLNQAYAAMLAQGNVNIEARGLRKDGSIFHKQLFMVTAYDDRQQRQGHYCFMKDISERAQLEAERRQAESALQQELERLSEVVETQQKVALVNPHLEQVMAVIAAGALSLTRADGAAVEILEGAELVCQAGSGIAQAHLGWRLPLADSLGGQCLTEGRTLYCADVDREGWSKSSVIQALGLRSMVVVPLTYQAERVGVIKVFSCQPNAFTGSDRQTLQLMAGFLAASLHLAREFEAKTTLLQELQDSEERYRSVVAALSEGVAVVQADGVLLTCNASAAKILGLQSWQIVGRSLADMNLYMIGEDGSPCPQEEHPALLTLSTGQLVNNQVMGVVKPDGITWISCNTRPLFHPNERLPYAVVLSFTDITELRRSEVAALRRRAEQERLLSEIAQRIRQTLDLKAILTTTVTEVQQFLRTDRVLIYRLEASGQGMVIAEAITAGCPPLLGQQVHSPIAEARLVQLQQGNLEAVADLQAEPDRLCPLDGFTQARAQVVVPIVQGNRLWGMLMAHHSQGPRPWETSELDVLKRLAIQLAIAIQQSQLYQHIQTVNRQLEHLATHDGLTQVANRRSFDTYLQQEWGRLLRAQAPLSLILCDIDHFKQYNDTYGHPAGDVCLQRVAHALEQMAKRPADLVARYGGEEFALVLPDTDQTGAEAIARAIQQALAELALFHGASPLGQRITLSLGIASVIPTVEQQAQTLIDQADAALYAAKQQGRDRYRVFQLGG